MTRRAWFCYELDQSNTPVPCLYYDEIPKSHGKRKIVAEIPLNDVEVTLSFASLCVIFPYKGSIDNSTASVVSSNKEKQDMTHPVSGYLTSQGKFFETQPEADLYEARYALNKATTDAVVDLGVSDDAVETAVAQIIAFINYNGKLIEQYLFAKRVLDGEPPVDDMDGSTTASDQTDDTPIRDGSSGEVATTSDAEAITPPARAVSE